MTFDEILPAVRAGGRARRALWTELGGRAGTWLQMVILDEIGPALACPLPDGGMVLFACSQQDILADDWEILP